MSDFSHVADLSADSAENGQVGNPATFRLRDLRQRWLIQLGAPPFLIFCAFLMDVWHLAWAAAQWRSPALADLANIDFLTLTEWGFILFATARLDFTKARIGRSEGLVTGLIICCGATFVAPASHVHIVPCVWFAARFARARTLWPLCLSLLLVSLQRVPAAIAPTMIYDLSIAVDVWAAHTLLTLTGFANEITNGALRLTQANHAIRVAQGCDTLHQLPPAITALIIFAICRNRRLDVRFAGLLLATVALVFAVNWLRLCLMTLSHDNYLYWHGAGAGAGLVAMALAMIPFLLSNALPENSRGWTKLSNANEISRLVRKSRSAPA